MDSNQCCRLVPRDLELPAFARRYRGAFRSGSGSETTGLTRFVNRMLYYVSGSLSSAPAVGRFRLQVRDEERLIEFNSRNLQFNALYFEKYQSGYEPDVAATIIELLPADGVFYDIGSNWGYFSVLVASRPEFRGRVHAFEPWPASFEDVRSVVAQAGLEAVVSCHNLALSDETGTAAMASGRHSGLAHLTSGQGSGVQVRTVKIDELELDPPDVMKIDAEGAELKILNGGAKTLAAARPFLVFENSYKDQELAAIDVLIAIERLGYRLFMPMLQFRTPAGEALLASAYSQLPAGSQYERLALQPLSARGRLAFREYVNLLAVPVEKIPSIERLL